MTQFKTVKSNFQHFGQIMDYPDWHFLGMFAKLWKAAVSLIMSVRLSIHPHGTVRLPLDGFSWNLSLNFFSKSCRENASFINLDKNNGYVTWRPMCVCMIVSRLIPLRMRMFHTKVVEKIKTHILCSITCFWKSCHLWDNVEKYGRAR
jgi:hypothetical protein